MKAAKRRHRRAAGTSGRASENRANISACRVYYSVDCLNIVSPRGTAMTHLWISATVISLALADPAPDSPPAGVLQAIPAKQEQAIQKTRQLLAEKISIEPTDMPLGKLLAALEKQLPEGKKLSLRIDTQAFGKESAKVAEAPIRLPKMQKVSLGTVVRLAVAQVKIPTDYRFGDGEYVITTPARAMYTAAHEIGDLLDNPAFDPTNVGAGVNPGDALFQRKVSSADKPAAVVRLIVAVVAPESWYPTADPRGAIQVVNTQLLIHANAGRHAEVAELLEALRRLSDISVTVNARLYEVDRELYMKVKNAKRLTRAELEKLEEKEAPEVAGLVALLKKSKLTVNGKQTKIANGQEASFLAHHRVVSVPPILDSDKVPPGLAGNLTEPQAALEGVSFAASVTVSADRRFVKLKIKEKSTEIDQLPHVQLPPLKKKLDAKNAPDVQEQVQDLLDALRRAGPLEPVLSETVHTQETDIPDGGSRMIAVHVRPRSLQAAERWWLLVVSPRIIINAEERAIEEESLKQSLPALLTDILTNPRLKTTRAFYGSPDDSRFALVASERWAWPATEQPLAVPEHKLTPPLRQGKRLLGIRIDDFQWTGKEQSDLTITVRLVNAGGTDNGAVPGGCRLRYTARTKDKKWLVELADGLEP
jgi:hypothetical protein